MRKRESSSGFLAFYILALAITVIVFCLFFAINCSSSQLEEPQQAQQAEAKESQQVSESLEIPVCPGFSHQKDHQIRKFKYYSICYRESYEQAEWSAEIISKEHIKKSAARANDFRIDPEILTGSADLADYKKSGFDRGHLTPAADMSFDSLAMSETFYMSNMSPQFPAFNRGIWKDLEEDVRSLVKKYGQVYLVTGPILEKAAAEYETIGKNKVTIPQYFYKVMLFKNESGDWQTLAYIIPNKKCDESPAFYRVTVDQVEERANLDFFSPLDDETENLIESR